jgi:hypothetical protein
MDVPGCAPPREKASRADLANCRSRAGHCGRKTKQGSRSKISQGRQRPSLRDVGQALLAMGDGVPIVPHLAEWLCGKLASLNRKPFRRLGGKSPNDEISFGGEGRDLLQKQYDTVGTGFEHRLRDRIMPVRND